MIRCVVAHKHALIRDLLYRALRTSTSIQIVGQFDDAQEAAQQAITSSADILLMYSHMPGFCSFQAARWVKARSSRLKTVIMCPAYDQNLIERTIRAGAHGLVAREETVDSLVGILERVHRGETFIPHPKQLANAEGLGLKRLTNREEQVLKYLAEGNTVKQVSILLTLAAKTVEVHKSHLMAKLDVHNRAELVWFAIRNKVVELEAVP